jgi:CBS domain-containing protein
VIGFITIHDIVTLVIWGSFRVDGAPSVNLQSVKAGEIVTLTTTPEGERLWKFEPSEPLGRLLDAFAKGVHRCLLGDKFISQTDCLKWLRDSNHPNLRVSARSLNLYTTKPLTVDSQMTTLDAYRKMFQEGHTAAAIVTKEGHLQGTLSASDMRGFTDEFLEAVKLPVSAFVKPNLQSTVNPSTHLGDVIKKALDLHHHRVWVCEEVLLNFRLRTVSSFVLTGRTAL